MPASPPGVILKTNSSWTSFGVHTITQVLAKSTIHLSSIGLVFFWFQSFRNLQFINQTSKLILSKSKWGLNSKNKKCTAQITQVLAEIYTQSAPNNSNDTYTFMGLGRAGRFGQS